MDVMSMAASIMASQAGSFQQEVGTLALKQNLDTQQSAVLTLLGAAQQTLSLANVGAGIGSNLNIAA